MQPRVSVITLGVKDIGNSRKFYEGGLGWKASQMSDENLVAFQLQGLVLCLYPEKLLADDSKSEISSPSFRGITLAYNVEAKEQVKSILDQAVKAGGRLVKPAQDVFWGGHSGYFADPDGHLWEIAWNPFWTLKDDGSVHLPC